MGLSHSQIGICKAPVIKIGHTPTPRYVGICKPPYRAIFRLLGTYCLCSCIVYTAYKWQCRLQCIQIVSSANSACICQGCLHCIRLLGLHTLHTFDSAASNVYTCQSCIHFGHLTALLTLHRLLRAAYTAYTCQGCIRSAFPALVLGENNNTVDIFQCLQCLCGCVL